MGTERDLQPVLQRVCLSHHWYRRPGDPPRHTGMPLDMGHVRRHLSGERLIGACPITPGQDTTRLALFDLDDVAEKDDVKVVELVKACEQQGLVPNLFYSSSGTGRHIYFLWERPQSAHAVRMLLATILMGQGLVSGTKGFPYGQVEIFPKQDQVPQDGFGSMFILPFGGNTKADWADPCDDWRYSTPVPEVAQPAPRQPSANDQPVDLDHIHDTLACIPNSGTDSLSYDDWWRIVAAVHHATNGAPQGLRLVEAFSAKSLKHDADFLEHRVWPYLHGDRDAVISFKTVEAMARQHRKAAFLALEPVEHEEPGKEESPRPVSKFVKPLATFLAGLTPPEYVWDEVLQRNCLYALTARWGHGKTAIALSVALHIAAGKDLCGRRVQQGRVLYLCGENPADVRLRVAAGLKQFDISAEQVGNAVLFTERPFAIDHPAALGKFIEDVSPLGPFALAVIDTGPAHSAGEEENDNREMQALAMAMREFMEPLGGPATLALMHPAKEAGRDSLQPRGGGAFSGSIDGELCAWQEQRGYVELFHRTKFRGPGFDPLWWRLEQSVMDGLVSNFGGAVRTVVAVPSSGPPPDPQGRWQMAVMEVMRELGGMDGQAKVSISALVDAVLDAVLEEGEPRRASSVKRAIGQLVEMGLLFETSNGVQLS